MINNKITKSPRRNRFGYAVSLALVIGLGLLWRSSLLSLSGFVSKYGGDALWALAVFLGVGLLFRDVSTLRNTLIAVCLAWSIEFSQLYHAPWIESLRATRPGHLILGSTFNSPDLLAYIIGIALGAMVERLYHRKKVSPP